MPPSFASRTPKSLLALGAACVAFLVILVFLWYLPSSPANAQIPVYYPPFHGDTVLVFDTDFSPDYWTNNSTEINYLATPVCYPVADPNVGCPPGQGYILTATCPNTPQGCANVTPGETFTYNLTLINTGNASHAITSFFLQAPFTLVGVSPSLPHTLAKGLPGTTFSMLIRTPTTPGAYDLAGTVNCV
jgi:hypothetical protein